MYRRPDNRVLASLLATSAMLTLLIDAARADVFNMGPGLTSLEFVAVGNPLNEADPEIFSDGTTGYGSVAQRFRMGKFEVTAAQYAEFLNAVAADDTYGLYNPLMDYDAGDLGSNIKRSGSPSSYTYSVASDWANRPVNHVSFWDATRFANWLHNGQPTGPQGPGTTEDGGYHDVGTPALFGRNPDARFFIPTENEWYKAAYHDPSKPRGTSEPPYWDYPTRSDVPPINTLPDPPTGNHANFYDQFMTGNGGYTIGSPYYRTMVGEFNNSPSPYGTFDQGGNVWEWSETDGPICTFTRHCVLGGSFSNWSNSLRAGNNYAGGGSPSTETNSYGFRVASIPEPSTVLLGMLGVLFGWLSFAPLRGGRERS